MSKLYDTMNSSPRLPLQEDQVCVRWCGLRAALRDDDLQLLDV
jgi:hypothetical protein